MSHVADWKDAFEPVGSAGVVGAFVQSAACVASRCTVTVDREFDKLVGTRRRQLEKPLLQIEALRLQKGLPVDGELFAEGADAEDATPPGGTVRALGA